MITGDQVTDSDKACAQLRMAIEQARTTEEKLAAQKQLDELEAQHRELHQAYTEQCRQNYMQKLLSQLRGR